MAELAQSAHHPPATSLTATAPRSRPCPTDNRLVPGWCPKARKRAEIMWTERK